MAEDKSLILQAAPTSATLSRALRFCGPGVEAMAQASAALWREGWRRFVLRGDAGQVDALARRLSAAHPELKETKDDDAAAARPDSAFLYPGLDEAALAEALMTHLDDRNAAILAERGERHWSNLPLFLISIPKSGTHLLYEFARALGYSDGIMCPDVPKGGAWYCVEYSNSHTRAADFLIDTTRRASFGNKHHPFFRSPALFIYRNPRDILVSESNWFHKTTNSPVAGYLCDLSPEERLLRLVDDPWLLGTIRDRVGAFIPWLSFPNVIPLSFEEIVGEKGGGSDAVQLDLIWSIQLKLQADGTPEGIARKIFNPDSPTFTEGRVGGWSRRATPEVRGGLGRLPSDFLQIYGYADEPAESVFVLPTRADEFRRRRLRLAKEDFSGTPILVETGYLDHNVVQLGREFYAVPQAAGPVSLERLGQDKVAGLVQATSLAAVKAAVLRKWISAPEVLRKLRPLVGRFLRRARS